MRILRNTHLIGLVVVGIALAGCGAGSIPVTVTPATARIDAVYEPDTLQQAESLAGSIAQGEATVGPLLTPTRAVSASVAQSGSAPTQAIPSGPATSSKPVPCNIDGGQDVYLVIVGERRHILDQLTFDNLGYKPGDIAPCGDQASLPEGEPFTRLLKGTSEKVYLVDLGLRRWIPDMPTLESMGFGTGDITTVPDDVLAAWPLGLPMPVVTPSPASTLTPTPNVMVIETISIGGYVVRLWHSPAFNPLHDYVTISHAGQPDLRIDDVEGIGTLPVEDVTGEGNPDVMFLLRYGIGSHCCWGTQLYDLGEKPVKVLDVISPSYTHVASGRGEFRDLNGDGVHEFITLDAVPQTFVSEITAILRYDAGKAAYLPASPYFTSSYDEAIAQMMESTQPGQWFPTVRLVATLMYAGRHDDARKAYDRLYTAEDKDVFWDVLVRTIKAGRYYTEP